LDSSPDNPGTQGWRQIRIAFRAAPDLPMSSPVLTGDISPESPEVPMKRSSFAVSAVAILAAVAVTPVAAGQRAMQPLAFNTSAYSTGNSSRMALEHHACAVTMGLHQPGDLYDTCIRSLRKSLSELDQARLASTDRSACAQERLEPGTPAFAVCVVEAENSPADAGRHEAIASVH
jgi:hypothetical protein